MQTTSMKILADRDPIESTFRRLIQTRDFHGGAVLVNLPLVPIDFVDFAVARNRGYFAYPPTTQLYLSAIFRALGISSTIIDLNYELLNEAQKPTPNLQAAWQSALDQGLATYEHPLVCVSLMFESTLPAFEDACRYIRAVMPTAYIVAGGVAATADPENLLKDGLADLVFMHEGEQTIAQFYRYLKDDRQTSPTNLVFRGEDGQIYRFPSVLGGGIDVDIRQEYEKIDIADYCRIGSISSLSRMNGAHIPYATVLSRRGCRARCSFCGVRNFNGKGVRVRNADGVVEEMRHLRDKFGVRHFVWLDDDLLYNREDAIRLFNGIAERLPDVTWSANNGLIASAISAELLAPMELSGCTGFHIGLESGNAEVLRRIHKPTNLDKFFEFTKLAQEFPSMFISVNMIVGFPGETMRQMFDSFVASIRGELDWTNFYLYQHLKNTELYLAQGSMSGEVLKTDYSRDGQEPIAALKDSNPVRAVGFKEMSIRSDVAIGYDVFDLPMELVPSAQQLREIWFTFSMIRNFLLMPALRTASDRRLKNGIRWIRALLQAYPRDAAMAAALYYLENRARALNIDEIGDLREQARHSLNTSTYWKMRDNTFGFSRVLDDELPMIDNRFAALF